jgi:glycosyltransferase involved in cell wall biosynthesis
VEVRLDHIADEATPPEDLDGRFAEHPDGSGPDSGTPIVGRDLRAQVHRQRRVTRASSAPGNAIGTPADAAIVAKPLGFGSRVNDRQRTSPTYPVWVAPRWIVFRERSHQRWGGDLRRRYVLAALASRGDAVDVDGWSPATVRRTVAESGGRWLRRSPLVAAATLLAPDAIDAMAGRAEPFAVDFHDDPLLQSEALGVAVEAERADRERERKRRNLEAFRWHIVPSRELADFAGLDPAKVIVAGNGTDTEIIRAMPWPAESAVGMMSGAAPMRGIEQVIEAIRQARSEFPDLRLILWLAATGAASERYLAELRAATSDISWIEYGSAPYDEIGHQLRRATIQCVPNLAGPYWDSVSPLKLFDAMASGRPVVVTPRRATAAVVQRHEAGLVTRGDSASDIAEQIVRLLSDRELAQRLGANGRHAAVALYDWSRISSELATTLVASTSA